MEVRIFQQAVLAWFDRCGRKDLPWQTERTPYRVWISEVMLQQTQVSTVIPYFARFMARFPDVEVLAAADLDAVLQHWAGLGYYARARNLHAAAREIVAGGGYPEQLDDWCALPGIGRSTAGAILSIAFQQSQPILDGNVKRVLARYHGLEGWPGAGPVSRELWALSERYTPLERVAEYTQAMMDLGATVCTRAAPLCEQCPLAAACRARQEGRCAELPAPRPGKRLPVRSGFLLLLSDARGCYYLERRPPAGIWGGLWCLPQFADPDGLEDYCRRWGVEAGALLSLPMRRHTFSHFHFDFTPVAARLSAPQSVMEAGGGVWYNHKEDQVYGLPAPVRRLLDGLDETGE